MMQEYDDDFFFEEDKMNGIAKTNGAAETNGAIKKSSDTWDAERKKKFRERITTMRLAAEKRRKRYEIPGIVKRPNRPLGASSGKRFDPRNNAAGPSLENAFTKKGIFQMGPVPEWQQKRRLIQPSQNKTAALQNNAAGPSLENSLTKKGIFQMGPVPEWQQNRRLIQPSQNKTAALQNNAAGPSLENSLTKKGIFRMGPVPEWQQKRRLIQPSQNKTAALHVTLLSQESTKDVTDLNVLEEKPTDEKDELKSPDCIFNDLRQERYMIHHQDLMGMTVTSGNVVLKKDEKNLIGISIGGGAPLCPCLYIVQLFEGAPASKDGMLQCGDELVGINGQSVKGKTKVDVAKMIQNAKDEVTINYNKLHADPKQGISLDIITKKVKHRLVEKMSSGTADALGLSRAILCNDTLVAKLDELKETETVYRKLMEHAKRMLKSYFDLLQTYKAVGDIFASIGVREPQARASEAFTNFGQYHRVLEKDGIKMLKGLKPILADLGTYLNKAIPDTKLTIRKYADVKFEYLSYCLKVKEMDDEEFGFNALQEPLYRVETGNYEYRLILRCRQEARDRFARMRSDVLVKLELLENKKTQDVALQLQRFIAGFAAYHDVTLNHLKDNASLFPIEVDLSQNAFQYKSTAQVMQDNAEDEEDIEFAKELKEFNEIVEQQLDRPKDHKVDNRRPNEEIDSTETVGLLLADFDAIDTFALSDKIEQDNFETGNANMDKPDNDIFETGNATMDNPANDNFDKTSSIDKADLMDDMSLLNELGLDDLSNLRDFQNEMFSDFMSLNMDSQDGVDDVFDKMLSDL